MCDLIKQNESHVSSGPKWGVDTDVKKKRIRAFRNQNPMSIQLFITKLCYIFWQNNKMQRINAYNNWMCEEINIPDIWLILLDWVTYCDKLVNISNVCSMLWVKLLVWLRAPRPKLGPLGRARPLTLCCSGPVPLAPFWSGKMLWLHTVDFAWLSRRARS